MKPLDPNDPRITTYALCELTADERDTFEAQLADSPEARAEVENVRDMSAMLEKDFADELAEQVPSAVEDEPLPKPAPRRWKAAMIVSTSIAAVLAIGGLALVQSLVVRRGSVGETNSIAMANPIGGHEDPNRHEMELQKAMKPKVDQSVSMTRDAATQIVTDEATGTDYLVSALPTDVSVGSRFGDTEIEASGLVISPDVAGSENHEFRAPAATGSEEQEALDFAYINSPDEANTHSLSDRVEAGKSIARLGGIYGNINIVAGIDRSSAHTLTDGDEPYINKPDEGNGVSLRSRARELERTDNYAAIGNGDSTSDFESAAIDTTSSAPGRVTLSGGVIVNTGSIRPNNPGGEGGTIALRAGGDVLVRSEEGARLSVVPAQTSQIDGISLTGGQNTAEQSGAVVSGLEHPMLSEIQRQNVNQLSSLGLPQLDDAIEIDPLTAQEFMRKKSEKTTATAGRTFGVGGAITTGDNDDFAFIYGGGGVTRNPLTAGLRSGAVVLEEGQIDELIIKLRPSAVAMTEEAPAKNESLFGTSLAALPAVQTLGRVAPLIDNTFTDPLTEPLSTFSVDVDSASYTTIRRSLLRENRVPHPDTVRIEEMVNYFDYPSYAKANWNVEEAEGEAPFSITLDSATAPWDENKRIVRIGLRGAEVADTERPPLNLAFLLDVSGSMSSEDKLPLMQEALAEFVPQLRRDDKVTIVVYAGSSGEVLPPTAGSDHATIREALGALSAGGSTAGASGITLAYQRAREHFIEDGINQVILATDGDFNVGVSDDESLVELVESEAESGVFLTVLGFGSGNLNDSMLEKITNQGNGQYHYIDRIEEGRRVLVEELTGTLVPIAKDVKVQVEFNPAKVASYRLIGYANRMLEAEDFADDTVDASEIGAGHTVTALYEVLPVANLMQVTDAAAAPDLKYQKPPDEPKISPFEARQKLLADRGLALTDSNEWLTVKLRYKKPKEDVSVLLDRPMVLEAQSMNAASDDLRFASAVAAFGMTLRGNADVGLWGLENVLALAKGAADDAPARTEFITMIERAIELTGAGSTAREVKEKLEAIR